MFFLPESEVTDLYVHFALSICLHYCIAWTTSRCLGKARLPGFTRSTPASFSTTGTWICPKKPHCIPLSGQLLPADQRPWIHRSNDRELPGSYFPRPRSHLLSGDPRKNHYFRTQCCRDIPQGLRYKILCLPHLRNVPACQKEPPCLSRSPGFISSVSIAYDQHLHTSSSFIRQRAFPRWLILFFSSMESSAEVQPYSGR